LHSDRGQDSMPIDSNGINVKKRPQSAQKGGII